MTPESNPTGGQGHMPPTVQPGISPAAQWYMSLKAEAQPGASPGTAPPDPGQGGGGNGGTPPAGGGEGFNWGNFPDVPEEQRALLEPHLKGVQGHVTKMEQQYAPYKPFIEGGMDAETVQGIMQLNAAFDKDPMGTWVQMGREMQERGLLPRTLEMDAVSEILEGKEDLPEEGEGGGEGEPDMPAWAQQLQQENAERQQREQQTQEQQQNAQQQAQLDQAIEAMKTQLKDAGLSDDQIEKANLVGAIITNEGDPDKALQSVIDFWSLSKAGIADNRKGQENGGPEMPRGEPKPPDSGLRGRGRSSAYAEANKGAKQMLDRLNAEQQA